MRYQIASDLHLEKRIFSKWTQSQIRSTLTQDDFWLSIIEPEASILILAGDIGGVANEHERLILELFLTWTRRHFDQVVYVAGNHEFYDLSWEEAWVYLQSICQRQGVDLLENQLVPAHHSQKTFILGATLWSQIPPDYEPEIQSRIRDYTRIHQFHPSQSNALHQQSVQWFEETIRPLRLEGKNIIAVSHHAPIKHISSAPSYRGQLTGVAFHSDQSKLLEQCQVWIFGHTHHNLRGEYYECQIESNQLGFPYDTSFKTYRPNYTFDLAD